MPPTTLASHPSRPSRALRLLTAALLLAGALVGATAAGTGERAQAAHTVKLTGYGGDSCTAPSESQMSAFWRNTPFSYWGIYIGGSDRGCSQPNLTQTWVHHMIEMGWDLLPLWVGPQNPCVGGQASYFSKNTTTARSQGVAEAKKAYTAWKHLSTSDNVPIDYDMEAGGSDSSTCRAATKAFIDGWVAQLHTAPAQQAGVYSSSCAGYLDDFASISHRPDFIDGADWDGSPSTGGISCVPLPHWDQHQRHKQYQGGHNATYNGVTLNIDSRCSDAQVFGTASRLTSNHKCALHPSSAATRAAADELQRSEQSVDWHGTQWQAGGPRSSQLRRLSGSGTSALDVARRGTPTRVGTLPLATHDVTTDAPNVGRPATLADGSLLVPVTEQGRQLLYTTRDGAHFTRRAELALSGTRAAGVTATTAVVGGTKALVIDPDATHAQLWSPSGTTRFAVHGLPGAPESLRFTGAHDGRALVESGDPGAVGKDGAPTVRLYRTTDGGHTWHVDRP